MTDTSDDFDINHEFGALNALIEKHPPFLADGLDDATVVLLGTSLLDEFLKLILIASFNADILSKNLITNVFESDGGPLSKFSSKISLCLAMGLIYGDVRDDLTILRKIRNDFAHSFVKRNLSEFPRCDALKISSKWNLQDDSPRRLKFKNSCLGLIVPLSLSSLAQTAKRRFLKRHSEEAQAEFRSMLDAFANEKFD